MLLSYVSPHDVFINVAYCFGKIPIRPKAISPQKLFELWILFSYHPTRSPFEPLYPVSHPIVWLRLDDNMYVVLFDTQLTDPPLIHPACFPQQLPQADDHFASQYPPTILRYPHQVVLQTVFRMGPSLVSGHSQIMSEFDPAFYQTGLKKGSIIKTEKIAVVHQSLIRKELGYLSSELMQQVKYTL